MPVAVKTCRKSERRVAPCPGFFALFARNATCVGFGISDGANGNIVSQEHFVLLSVDFFVDGFREFIGGFDVDAVHHGEVIFPFDAVAGIRAVLCLGSDFHVFAHAFFKFRKSDHTVFVNRRDIAVAYYRPFETTQVFTARKVFGRNDFDLSERHKPTCHFFARIFKIHVAVNALVRDTLRGVFFQHKVYDGFSHAKID